MKLIHQGGLHHHGNNDTYTCPIPIETRSRLNLNIYDSSSSNSPLLVKNYAIQLFNEHWYLSVKNTEVHDGTLNVITAIKLSDTDNVVVVGTDVNLLILLSKRSHHSIA